MSPTVALEALCLRGLIRHLGNGGRSAYGGPTAHLRDEDIEALRMWWAMSQSVGALASRCASNPREITPSLDEMRREVTGELPGVPDAAASARLQAMTLDPAAFVVTEAVGSWISGPNRVLAKTLDAARDALRAAALHARGGIFDGPARDRLSLIDDALNTAPLRELLASPAGRGRIVAHERRQAAKARAPLYRLAWQCASMLSRIDALDEQALATLFAREVLPRLETWRRFEMACMLEISDALSASMGSPSKLDTSFAPQRPAVGIGNLRIWWQRGIPSRPFENLDAGEQMAVLLAESLGTSSGTARADITVETDGRILGIVECKWFESPSSRTGAILEACEQLTGYARDAAWKQHDEASNILSRSFVALADRGETPLTMSGGLVGCIGLSDLGKNSLALWADSIVAAL